MTREYRDKICQTLQDSLGANTIVEEVLVHILTVDQSVEVIKEIAKHYDIDLDDDSENS